MSDETNETNEKNRDLSSINVTDIVENEDGSATVTFDMTPEVMRLFAGIGILKVLVDSAQAVIDENES